MATNEVRVAIEHVRISHPEVTRAYFDDSRWLYTDSNNRAVRFRRLPRDKEDDGIDVEILDAALDSLNGNPVAFNYNPNTRELIAIEPVEDIEQLYRPATS